MRTRQEGAGSLPGKTCVIVKIATTGCDRAEDELLELTLLDARTRLDTPVMAPPLYFGRFRPFRHRDWPEARARNGLAPSDVRDAPAPDDPRERGRIQRVLDGTDCELYVAPRGAMEQPLMLAAGKEAQCSLFD